MPSDLFISYSRRDNERGRVTDLVERIKQNFASFAGRPLEPFFDVTEIQGMEDWRQRILQGLRESRLLLACLSPAYLESKYCEWEFVEYLKYEIGHLHGFTGVAPIYFVHVPGWGDKDFDQRCAAWVAELRRRQSFDLLPWYEEGEGVLREDMVRERMEKLTVQIAEAIKRGERAENSLGNVDAPNPHFVGRTANLRLLRENFVKPGHIGVLTAINGLGGLGKTGLAVEYAHAFADQYGGGRWQIRCEGEEDLRLALSKLATPIGFEFTDDEKKNLDLQFDRTRRELKKLADTHEPHRCLLFLDNVDNPKLLDPAQGARLNAGDWLHVLATTRLGENELYGTHQDRSFLAVDELPEEDALALIESYQPGERFRNDAERDAARKIVKLLGGFTLAVESAAVYLGQFANDVTFAGFLVRLQKEGLEALDTIPIEGVLHGEKRLGATLRATLERLNESEQLALTFAAFLPADYVALPWLRALVAKSFPEMEHEAEPGYPDPWKTLLRRLFSLRLLQPTNVMDVEGQPLVVRVHRLVQQLMLLDSPMLERAGHQQAIEELIQQRTTVLDAVTNWVDSRWELIPLTALAGLWDELEYPRTRWLLNQAGEYWRSLAEWSQAEPLMRRVISIFEKGLDLEHPDFATSLESLALLLQSTNRLGEAEPLLRRALAIDEKSSGPEHPNVARDINNLAVLLKHTNKLGEAEALMRWALAIDENSLGPEHPNVARDLNNLARLLQDTNRLGEAEPMMRRALAIDEKTFGFEHPKVAVNLNNLAALLQATNRLGEAEPLMRRALAIDEKSFGFEHPEVATSLKNLANLLHATNRLGEAEQLLRRALAIDEKSFGFEHPEVATSLNNLAALLLTTNRLGEAEPLIRRALAIDERSFGAEHPNITRDLNNLAALLQATNRLDEAEPLMRRALAIDEKRVGPEHPTVASDLSNLAQIVEATNRLDEAERLMRRAVAIDEKSFGPEHPDVAKDLNNLAALLQVTNRLGEAEMLLRRVILIFEKSRGFEHPNVATSLNNLAALLQAANRLGEAEPLMQRALAIDEKSFGPEHPAVARDLNNLAQLLKNTNRLGNAEPLMRRGLEIFLNFSRATGRQHPHWKAAIKNYEQLLKAMGRTQEEILVKMRTMAPELFPK
jgi:predicted component of type VI protein secretion system